MTTIKNVKAIIVHNTDTSGKMKYTHVISNSREYIDSRKSEMTPPDTPGPCKDVAICSPELRSISEINYSGHEAITVIVKSSNPDTEQDGSIIFPKETVTDIEIVYNLDGGGDDINMSDLTSIQAIISTVKAIQTFIEVVGIDERLMDTLISRINLTNPEAHVGQKIVSEIIGVDCKPFTDGFYTGYDTYKEPSSTKIIFKGE